jgi:hypothetical protein
MSMRRVIHAPPFASTEASSGSEASGVVFAGCFLACLDATSLWATPITPRASPSA